MIIIILLFFPRMHFSSIQTDFRRSSLSGVENLISVLTGRKKKSWKTEDEGGHPELDKPAMGECWSGGQVVEGSDGTPCRTETERDRQTDRDKHKQTDRQTTTNNEKENNK